MRTRRLVTTATAVALVMATGPAWGDQVILGRKLLLRNNPPDLTANKAVHLGKDPSLTVGAAGSTGDPQCSGAGGGGASSIYFGASGGAGAVSIPLPCAGWTTNAANTLYKYSDSTGATCRRVLLKDGVLVKAVCKGAQVAIDLNGGMAPVDVVTTLNQERYCTRFGGTVVKDGGDEKSFLAKEASAPAACPTTNTTPTSTTTSTTTAASACVQDDESCCDMWVGGERTCVDIAGSLANEAQVQAICEANRGVFSNRNCLMSGAITGGACDGGGGIPLVWFCESVTGFIAACCTYDAFDPPPVTCSLQSLCTNEPAFAQAVCEGSGGTWSTGGFCPPRTDPAACSGSACSSCGSSGTCFGACALSNDDSNCGHAFRSDVDVCFNIATCTSTPCLTDDDCGGGVCIGEAYETATCCQRCL